MIAKEPDPCELELASTQALKGAGSDPFLH